MIPPHEPPFDAYEAPFEFDDMRRPAWAIAVMLGGACFLIGVAAGFLLWG